MKKNIYKMRSALVVLLGLALGVFSCDDFKEPSKLNEDFILTDITLNVTNPLPLLAGTDSLISYTLQPDYATKRELVWESADESVATVDENGCITALKPGEVDITVRSLTAFVATTTLKVQVVDEIISMRELHIASATGENSVFETASLQLTVSYLPENTTYPAIKWSSDTPDIVSVTEDGFVTALAEGIGVIRAASVYDSSVQATYSITVNPIIPVKDVEVLDDEDLYLGKGQYGKLPIRVVPEDATVTALEWSSANPDIVEVTSDGMFTVKDYGTAVFTVSNGDFEKQIQVTVIEGKINDTFIYGKDCGWKRYDTGAALYVENGHLVVPLNNPWGPNNFRAEINRGTTEFHAGNYPILAMKMKYRGNPDLSGKYSYNLSIWGGNKAGDYGGGSNQLDVEELPDGSYIFYGDISENGPGFKDTNAGLPNSIISYQNVIYTFKDITVSDADIATGNTYYDMEWVKTFRSEEALNKFISSEK